MFLKFQNTNIGYKFPLIESISAGLELGEMCLIIGNNGIGKTTLLKSILNQIPVLEGEILLENKNIRNLTSKEIAKKIAVVFSKSQIPNNYTTTDLISLGKYIHYPYYFELKQTDKEEVTHIIDDLNLSQYKDLPLTKLSDGNLQKAFIGRALAQNSPMIILDEPTTHLDEQNKIAVLKILRNLAKKHNKVILFSSHDWRLAKDFADKIWYIKDKKLHAGIAEEILLKNPELISTQLSELNQKFVPPKIIAPVFEKELLFSFLQKNCETDLSKLTITLSDEIWDIQSENYHATANDFAEILRLIRNLG